MQLNVFFYVYKDGYIINTYIVYTVHSEIYCQEMGTDGRVKVLRAQDGCTGRTDTGVGRIQE